MERVTLEKARKGGVMAFIEGRPAFPDRRYSCPYPAGTVIYAEITGENPRKTVYFFRAVESVEERRKREAAEAKAKAAKYTNEKCIPALRDAIKRFPNWEPFYKLLEIAQKDPILFGQRHGMSAIRFQVKEAERMARLERLKPKTCQFDWQTVFQTVRQALKLNVERHVVHSWVGDDACAVWWVQGEVDVDLPSLPGVDYDLWDIPSIPMDIQGCLEGIKVEFMHEPSPEDLARAKEEISTKATHLYGWLTYSGAPVPWSKDLVVGIDGSSPALFDRWGNYECSIPLDVRPGDWEGLKTLWEKVREE